MHMGAMAVIGANAPKNLVHVIINNGAHETVGGMPTVAGTVDLPAVARACGYPRAVSVEMAEELTLERLGTVFGNRDRQASSNYAVDTDGRVALYVEERDRAWTSSSKENDDQAVTIEVANDRMGGDWHVSDEAYAALVELCTDICRRNGIPELTYTGDAGGTLTTHRMFRPETECPGPYLAGRMEELAREVNRRLAEES